MDAVFSIMSGLNLVLKILLANYLRNIPRVNDSSQRRHRHLFSQPELYDTTVEYTSMPNV